MINRDGVPASQIFVSSGCYDDLEKSARLKIWNAISAQGLDSILQATFVDQVPDEVMDRPGLITDNRLERPYWPLWPDFYGIYSYQPIYQDAEPDRLFNCFINRADSFRQSWIYHLQRRGLIDQGYVSYLLYYRSDDIQFTHPSSARLELYDHLFAKGNQPFAAEHQALRDRMPFCNFEQDLEQAMVQSQISLVLETYFEHPDRIALSEKIFRALSMPRPVLLFSCMGAVSHLRHCGFDMFDDIVNHDYDWIANNVLRQQRILDILSGFGKARFTTKEFERLQQGCRHNRALLAAWRESWPDRLEKTLTHIQQHK